MHMATVELKAEKAAASRTAAVKSTLLPASKLRMVVSASTVPLPYLVVMLPLKRGRLQRCWVSMLRATMHDAQRQGGRARHAIGNSRLRLGAEDE